MAAVSASFVTVSLATAALQPPAAQKLSVGRFNGLKAFPGLRQRAVITSPTPVRNMTICAAAREETLKSVQDIIANRLAQSVDDIVPEAKFADLGADSLDTVEIIMALEENFKITLDEEGAQQITTVQEAADLIELTIAKSS